MKKGNIITAIDSIERASSKLIDILREATDDDIIHAAQYAYTDGGKIKGDSQQPRLKVLRTTLIKARGLTIKRKQGVWVVEKPAERAPRQPKGTSKTDTGNRSKPAKSLSGAQDKVVELVKGRSKTDQLNSIVAQMERLGITLGELEEFMAEREAMAANA